MMLTSYIALFYSMAIFGAVLLSSLVLRRNPIRICSSIMAGWLVILPWIPVLITHIQLSKLGWIPVPTVATLRAYFEGYLNPSFWGYAKILVLFASIAAVTIMIYGGRRRREGTRPREIALLSLVPCLAAVPFAIYCFSKRPTASSIFLERYMLASLLGWAILLAHLAHRALLMRHRLGLREVTWTLTAVQIIAISMFVGDSVRRTVKMARKGGRESAPPEILANVPENEQIVLELIHEFLQWHFYSPQRSRLVFLVDPEVGLKDGAGGPPNHAIMAALKRHFPAQFKEVMPTDEFLRTVSSFCVRHNPGLQWTPTRLEHNPAFSVEQRAGNLLHVQRRE